VRTGEAMRAEARGIPRILSDLADGHLTGSEIAAVVAWLEPAALESVPARIVNRAVRIACRARVGQSPRSARLGRLMAVLVYDTRLRPRPAGARGVGPGHRRLLYEADLVEIDLEVSESALADRLRLLGHVTMAACDLAHGWVTLDGPSGHREAPLDELGQFSLDGLVPGVHRLEIRLATELIEISELRL
jgi:hypothetical protein